MTARNRTTRAAASSHELDEAVIDTSKARMKNVAAPLLARILKTEARATKGIAKREAFLETSGELKQSLRDAYDAGDESIVATVTAALDKFDKSLLRASRR